MSELALLGGEPVRTEDFVLGYDPTSRQNLDEKEVEAVTEVIETGRLSGFLAQPSEEYYGGPKVKELEQEWSDRFNVDHAITFNSWTSGLFASVAAADLDPGDEVIVTPLTMSACPAAILANDAIPVFADVKAETANINPESIRECITDRTEAIMPVHILGYPAEMDEIMDIAEEHNLIVIEDAAQAIGAKFDGEYAGTIGHIGGFSLNVHKHIQTGEGGVITTDDDELAQRARLVRNHAESIVGQLEDSHLEPLGFDASDMVGQNYRMTEVTAAIGIEQLKKYPDLLQQRVERANQLRDEIESVEIVDSEPIRDGSTHSYYGFPMWYNPDVGRVELSTFLEALNAEGVPAGKKLNPLYNLPIYQEGNIHTNGLVHRGSVDGAEPVEYAADLCPTAQKLHDDILIWTDTVMPESTSEDITDITRAIKKIEQNIDQLREYATS